MVYSSIRSSIDNELQSVLISTAVLSLNNVIHRLLCVITEYMLDYADLFMFFTVFSTLGSKNIARIIVIEKHFCLCLYFYPPFPSPSPLTIFPFSISLFSPSTHSPLTLSPSSSMSILFYSTDIFTVTDALCCLTFIQSAQS